MFIVFYRVLRNQENLETSGNFCLVKDFFTLVVFGSSLSVQMPANFLDPSKTAGKNVKSRKFEKLSLKNLEKSGNFYERNPGNPDLSIFMWRLSHNSPLPPDGLRRRRVRQRMGFLLQACYKKVMFDCSKS